MAELEECFLGPSSEEPQCTFVLLPGVLKSTTIDLTAQARNLRFTCDSSPSFQVLHLPAVLLAHPPKCPELVHLHTCSIPSQTLSSRGPRKPLNWDPSLSSSPPHSYSPERSKGDFIFLNCKSNQLSLLLKTLQWLPATFTMKYKLSPQLSQHSVTWSLGHSTARLQGHQSHGPPCKWWQPSPLTGHLFTSLLPSPTQLQPHSPPFCSSHLPSS